MRPPSHNRLLIPSWVQSIAIALIALISTTALAQPGKPKTRDISGVVVDLEAKPIANATIAIVGTGTSTQTGAEGSFKLAGVAATNLTIELSADGYTPRRIQVIGAPTPLQLDVTLVHPAPAAPPPPAATRMIAGVVTDPSHGPVAGATVRVHGTKLETVTASDGTFVLPSVDPVEVVLDVEAAGQPPTSAAIPATKGAVAITIGEAAKPTTPLSRTVKGTVTEPGTKEPIPGASVAITHGGAVVFTEADGSFVLDNAPLGAFEVEITATGHETRTVAVAAGKASVDVTLAAASSEQIVIEGRAPVIVKSNLANGASVVSDKDLNRVSAPTVEGALQGKLAGANLQFNSGAPGGGAQLRLRGISTINGQSSPLFVIDGVVISNAAIPSNANAITNANNGGSRSNQDNPVNRIADLNPSDIETVEVLKGASAAALYGSKAANGVVIITTKRGHNGENHAEVTQRVGFSAVSNRLGSRAIDTVGETFDHEREIERTPLSLETIGSVSGGTDNGNYYGSMLIHDEPGVVIGTFYDKQSGRIALGYKLGDRLHLGMTANIIHSLSDRGLTNNDNSGTSLYVVLASTPSNVDLRPTNGVYPVNPAIGSGANPLQTVALFQNREDVWRLITGATAAFDAYASKDGTSSVRLLANFGVDSFAQKNNILSPPSLTFESADGLPGTSVDASTTNLNFNIGTGALWAYQPKTKKFKSALSGGLTYETVDLNSVYVTAQNLNAGQPNVDSGTAVTISQTRLRTKDSGLYAQEELAVLDDRLSLLAGLLGERSSLNGNTDKYFTYPKLAAVYSLLKPGNADDDARKFEVFRVRAAYGEAGNRPNYGQRFTPLNASSNIGGNAGLTVNGTAGDANIEPERQREVELGTDLATKDQKIVVELTGYQRSISNLLLERALATSTGFTTQFFNGGGMRNRGVEAAVQVQPVSKKGVEWTTRGILTLNRSDITSLPADVPPFDISAAGFGTGLGAFRIEPGKSATQIVATVDSSGTVKPVGNGEPDFRVGWSNVLTAGPFTFSALVDWQHGSNVINLTRLLYDFGNNSPDPEAAAKRLMAFTSGDARPYIEDASFVKVREVSIAYELPKRLATRIGPLRSLQVSLTGRNLMTFTGYSGLDPEVSNFGNQPIGRNYDVAPYPPSRSFWLSVTAGL